jgi:hypothetical protein
MHLSQRNAPPTLEEDAEIVNSEWFAIKKKNGNNVKLSVSQWGSFE